MGITVILGFYCSPFGFWAFEFAPWAVGTMIGRQCHGVCAEVRYGLEMNGNRIVSVLVFFGTDL